MTYQNNFQPRISHNLQLPSQRHMQECNHYYSDAKQFHQNGLHIYRQNNFQNIQNELSSRVCRRLAIPYFPNSFHIEDLYPTFYEDCFSLSNTQRLDPLTSTLLLVNMMLHATRGRLTVQLEGNWKELGSENLLLIGSSGTGKSTILNELLTPFTEFISEFEDPLQDFPHETKQEILSVARSINKKNIKEHIELLYDGGDMTVLTELVNDLSQKKNMLAPDIPDFFISLCTTLQLVKKLSQNGEAMSIIESEGDICQAFKKNQGLIEFILRAYSGDAYHTPKISLQSPCVQMLLYIQEKIGSEFYSNDSWINNGFMARFLPVFAKNKFNPQEANEMQHYAKKVKERLQTYHTFLSNSKRYTVRVSPDALLAIKSFQEEIKFYMHEFPEDSFAFLRRSHGHAVRLALAYHVWQYEIPHEHPINRGSMLFGINMVKSLFEHVSYAYSPYGFRALGLAKKIVDNLQNISPSEQIQILQNGITSTTIQKRTGKRAHEISNALTLLQQNDYLRIYDTGDIKNNVILHP